MAPRDVPDSSNILHTKRLPRKPRAPDEVVSLAPLASSLAPQQDSVVQAVQSPPPPILLSPSTIIPLNSSFPRPSSLPPTIISAQPIADRGGEGGVLTGAPSPADSMPALASPTSSQREITPLPVQISQREPATANEPGTVPFSRFIRVSSITD